MKDFFSELWTFAKCPENTFYRPTKIRNGIIDIYYSLAFYLITATVIMIPVTGVIQIIKYFFSIDLINIRNKNIEKSLGIYSLAIIALLAPIIEETVFRLWLTGRKGFIFLSIIAASWVIITKVKGISIYSGVNGEFFHNLVSAIFLGAIFFGVVNLTVLKKFRSNHFKLLYWGSSVAFGLIHIANFAPLKLSLLLIYPLLILPQMAMGFLLGFIRVKNGFLYAVMIHCLINLPGAIYYSYFFKN
ncbi:CPBP family glutamic-type intramembrane protease [Mucilaginibacter polytrichastri]|uniref:CAAX prenyl protease 2/Lysostaphin resistance protein A-like domain-containing protein n=1 Tax=Mucilaginibacter polytrichastri TaxID=1302689 RepID=A0A1Q5ZVZ8_9SPHI|nr:CPBP family glutamic-type intramembrane protease [Mucilaginibacter polytrichastri]OKS85913.1 hypothetical protein RG47T_1359 [Mucilaginibacter polytrichastri]SFS60607.1 CAAX protease self-immunity [Mucilaginibacter polytrichastri]